MLLGLAACVDLSRPCTDSKCVNMGGAEGGGERREAKSDPVADVNVEVDSPMDSAPPDRADSPALLTASDRPGSADLVDAKPAPDIAADTTKADVLLANGAACGSALQCQSQ